MEFEGQIASSKSLVNRYLILKQGHPDLNLKWDSKASDVLYLQKSLEDHKAERLLYVGEGGTTLRFLSLYLSTQKGEWILKGKESLFRRPQDDLAQALRDLGVEVKFGEESLVLNSEGWKAQHLKTSLAKTTQVATGLILSALASRQKIDLEILDLEEGSGYLDTTLKFIKELGFSYQWQENTLCLDGEQEAVSPSYKHIESDWSSAAFIYVLAALFGEARVFGLFKQSVQPDSIVLEILKSSGVQVSGVKVKKSEQVYFPIQANLQRCPDLFPVLCVFACFCRGESRVYGAPQLIYKETNRMEWMYRLLSLCGYKVLRLKDGLHIFGQGKRLVEHKPFSFDVSKDHRLFMAAEILRRMGYQIEINGKDSVQKSFPEFLEMDI